MRKQSNVLIPLFGLIFCLLSTSLYGQVIFKAISPVKRYGVGSERGAQGMEPGGTPTPNLDSTRTAWQNSGPAKYQINQADSVTQNDPDQTNAHKPAHFTVTYMGVPLERDSSTASKYRLLPSGLRSIPSVDPELTRFYVGGPDRFHQQDSLMVAMLEDSLRRIKDQITPLRSASRAAPQSAFNLFRTVPSILPVRIRSLHEFRISSAYGSRVHPISGRVQHHTGIDLPQPRLTPVYATADGVVDRILWQPGGIGLAVYIVHPSGYQTGYGHLEDHSVLVGESVRRGQVIGRVGSTGLATGPHLHYTVLAGTLPVDPASYCFLLLNALNDPKTAHRQPVNSKKDRRH